MREGILYVATGEKYINESIVSAQSCHLVSPTIHSTIVSNETCNHQTFNEQVHLKSKISHPKSGYLYKIEGIRSTPYDKTIFLDSDTYVTRDISSLFNLLNYFDLLICQDMWETADVSYNETIVPALHPYNTGMIAFKMSDKMDAFLKCWESDFKKNIDHLRHDQPAFMTAILKSDIKVFCLSSVFNFRPVQNQSIHYLEEVKVLHGHYSKEQFIDLEKKINISNEQRVWHAKSQTCLSWSTNKWIARIISKL